jgi:hypothetical protein
MQMEEMKCLLANHEEGVEKWITECLTQQTRKHDEDLKSLKHSQAAATNMFANPSRVIIYKTVEDYENMTKASDVLFDGNSDNWQAFKDHLTKEASNPTIGFGAQTLLASKSWVKAPPSTYSKHILTSHQIWLPDFKMTSKTQKKEIWTTLTQNFTNSNPWQLNSETASLTVLVITFEESMPMDISNNDGWIYFCLIISRTFPDKDAHKEILKNYILELKVTKSNAVESYQRDIDLLKHLKAY